MGAPPVVLIVLVLNATTGRNIFYRKTTPVIGDSSGEPTLKKFIVITLNTIDSISFS